MPWTINWRLDLVFKASCALSAQGAVDANLDRLTPRESLWGLHCIHTHLPIHHQQGCSGRTQRYSAQPSIEFQEIGNSIEEERLRGPLWSASATSDQAAQQEISARDCIF